ncbi:hypothetical protein PF004_g18867 [Phytophthora fragariae]|uniref:Secreted protein n=1 Tax=Phytophthora fragariae TaxID=53985 RepID=A0A6A3JDA4_9STRA|nr:hypothetical protein PF011_g18712 [Phytophthora fragariae]KAE9200912.1 hypothetical protein PF004_g18867 [Phytophthora fragariae]KAE9319012.1 hypothetical protein PF008_g18365 [Phytophthora fragariae]
MSTRNHGHTLGGACRLLVCFYCTNFCVIPVHVPQILLCDFHICPPQSYMYSGCRKSAPPCDFLRFEVNICSNSVR